jgi:hypothetical protein
LAKAGTENAMTMPSGTVKMKRIRRSMIVSF